MVPEALSELSACCYMLLFSMYRETSRSREKKEREQRGENK